jgi:uncharacterized membrane protein HdeD (DUF308 family)
MHERPSNLSTAAARWWWLPLVTGVAWLIVSISIFRFDYGSVAAIATLFGIIALSAAANEVMIATLGGWGWRILHYVLAVALAVIGIVAFVHPGDTFVGLAAVVSFFLIIRGSFDVITALSIGAGLAGWWVLLITGLLELLVGFWAAGSWGLSATLLVSWVGAVAFLHGLREIVGAIRLRDLGSTS